MTLEKYRKKRDFKKTAEPVGKKKSLRSHHLYLIQKHAASHLHYDFRLELDGVLKSWAIPKGPSLDPDVKRLAVHVEDHPIEYGAFEGIIPQGQYGGGTVMLWDNGTWEPLDNNSSAAYKKGHLKFSLQGEKLQGEWILVAIKRDPKNWLLMKVKDEFASRKKDVTKELPLSVTTGRTMDQIASKSKKMWGKKGIKKRKDFTVEDVLHSVEKSPMPKIISPQLCTLVDQPPEGKEWLHEIKLDGYRLIAYINNGIVRLMTRNNLDWTKKFPDVADALKLFKFQNAILDGEVVVLDDENKPDFQLLQNAIKAKSHSFVFYVFDLMYFQNKNITSLPLIQRKKILQTALEKPRNKTIRYNDHILGQGHEVFTKSCEMLLEGVVSKEINSSYEQKRSSNWLKIKCIKRQEFIIGGYTQPKGARDYFGSLLIGVYNDKKEFVYCGHVGTGFNYSTLKSLHSLLKKNRARENPFDKNFPILKNITWVNPKIIIEVEFTEWTKDGILRHPSFKGIRADKAPEKISKEKIQPLNKVKKTMEKSSDIFGMLTHPEKMLFPSVKISKLDIAKYYENIQDWILPYIINRPLSLVRCPDGVNKSQKECFYQKHLTASMPKSVFGKLIREKEKKENQIYIKDFAGLLGLVQMGVLEIHPWGSTITQYEKPDIITFDLDPGPNVVWKKVVDTAFLIKKEFEKLKLTSFVKTTGGKGLHVIIPIQPQHNWKEIKNFTHLFVDFLVTNNPTDYIDKMTKSKRIGKIFIDYLRNQRGATAIAPYSTRANDKATIATPLAWDELTNRKSDVMFTIKTIQKRLDNLKEDPWKNFFKKQQILNLKKYEK